MVRFFINKLIILKDDIIYNKLIIRTLSDYDKDGKLSLEEFIIAMYLCDYSKSGNTLPGTLPIELQPQRAKTATLPLTANNFDIFNSPVASSQVLPSTETTPPNQEHQQIMQHTFEQKRQDNFTRGNAVLEAKRQMLREAEERDKRVIIPLK